MFERTKKIDDFIIQLGKSAKGMDKESVNKLNSYIEELNLKDLRFTFSDQIEGSAELSVTGARVAQNTVMAIVDSETYGKAKLEGNLDYAHYLPSLPKEHKKFLKKQNIKFNKNTTGVIYFRPEILTGETPSHQLQIALHEIGHATSRGSGSIRESWMKEKIFDQSYDAVVKNEYSPQNVESFTQSFIDLMRSHGNEEGLAESFSFTNVEKRLKEGGKSDEEIASILIDRFDREAYTTPRSFSAYSDRYEDKLSNVFSNMKKEEFDLMKGPISGKVGLTVPTMMDEVLQAGRVSATTAVMGALESLPGVAGSTFSTRNKRILEELEEAAYEQFGGSGKDLIGAIKQTYSQSVNEKRTISITDKIKGRIFSQAAQTPDTAIRPTERSIGSVASSSAAPSRTSDMLKAVTQASEGVAKRNSRSMQVASAITTVMKKRLF